jgi:adenosylcobyric acid synthase
MNPVLLKPQTDIGAQVVVHGRVLGNATARDYHALKPRLLPAVMESFARLGRAAELVLVEGAGSPAEVNLRPADIANMGFAEAADLPVVLVGDIDRGGVIASLVGTHALLEPDERGRLAGYVINKFRGDKTLLAPALDIIAERTGLACHGIVGYFDDARHLPAEDAVALDAEPYRRSSAADGIIRIAVPRLARIANFDDLDPLAAEPEVAIELVPPGRPLPADADLVLLPGSKATLADLAFLRAQGWDIDLKAHVRRGGRVLGLCAGYQMLGRRVADPRGVEGPPGTADGLGLLDVETVLSADKTLRAATGRELATGETVDGYEMHMGLTEGPDRARPMLTIEGRHDGAATADGLVQGCYLHGLFAADGFRHAFLAALRPGRRRAVAYEARIEATLDALADHLEAHLDLDALLAIAQERGGSK